MLVSPLMIPGWGGAEPPLTVTLSVRVAEDPHALFDLTVIFPPVEPATAEIEFVVEVPDQSAGNVQIYEVAPATGVTVYTFKLALHTLLFPLMVPGCAGEAELVVTASDVVADEPQALLAFTVIFPFEEEAETVIEFEAELPVQPEGNVQV